MIFVTIGTQKQQFTRLFDLIEKSNYLKDKQVIAQTGNTNYTSNNDRIKAVSFLDDELLQKYLNECDFVISHGGVGTIFTALNLHKKILVVPRLKKYKEHKDNHQLEICKELQKENYLLYLSENENLDDKINELLTTDFKEYKKDNKFLDVLRKNI